MRDKPFRLRVLMAISAALSDISVADGYHFDMADKVFRGRDIFGGESDPVPMIAILEPPLPIDQVVSPTPSSGSTGQWDLLIQGFVDDDFENPTDPAHMLMADVKARLVKEKKRILPGTRGTPDPFGMGLNTVDGKNCSNVVTDIQIGPGVVRPPGDGVSNKAYFWLGITLKITEDIEQPFL